MLSPLVSWILPSSSSSSSSSSSEGEENFVTDDGDHFENVGENEHFHSEAEEFPSTSCAGDTDTIPVALAVPCADASPSVTVAFPGSGDSYIPNNMDTGTRERQRINHSNSKRQYQRLWTKQDEIELLRGYLDYIRQHRWATTSLQNDVEIFYDHIKPKLKTGFNKNQLVQKLRGLKRKHKITLEKINSGREVSHKNPQEKAIFDISHRIWGKNRDKESSPDPDTDDLGNINNEEDDGDEMENRVMRQGKRSRLNTDESEHLNDEKKDIQRLIEETMRSCLSPLIKEALNNAVEGSTSLRLVEEYGSGEEDGEKRRKQRILELEGYLMQLELLQDEIKARKEALRSSGD